MLRIFLDIEATFDNTSFDFIVVILQHKGIDDIRMSWIDSIIRGRMILATIVHYGSMGCKGMPTVLSPLL